MQRMDVTEGTQERAFTAQVYNEVSRGHWHAIKLNQVKTGGPVGRVRAASSEKKIETVETRSVLIQ
jgi:hypothetical protein